MSNTIKISGQQIDLDMVWEVAILGTRVELSEESRSVVRRCRTYLDRHLDEATEPIYGINTGFGSLCNTEIGKDDLEQLQEKLVMSHACGVGDEVPKEVVRAMLFLKVLGLSKGFSGIQESTLDRLLWMLNENVLPVIYTQGSLGASGDLAPLAHLSLPIIGKGEVWVENTKRPSSEVLEKHGLSPLKLQSKEGLALLNGTQFMSAYASLSVVYAVRMMRLANKIASVSLEGYHGTVAPFHKSLHTIRPHQGQMVVSTEVRQLLEGSPMQKVKREYVQDPYSFRCIPQVHGAIYDTIAHVKQVVETEINSVTDNPTVFEDEGLVLSGGNFHGQPLAMTSDFLAVALAELGSISERRTYKLISGTRGLSPFLTNNPGLNSGMMIPQYTAASIVSRNKQLCMPCSVDTIDSSNGQEDHVSMGANAVVRTWDVMHNVQRILAIELMNAAQALELRRPERSSEQIEKFLLDFRKYVLHLQEDRELWQDIQLATQFVVSRLITAKGE